MDSKNTAKDLFLIQGVFFQPEDEAMLGAVCGENDGVILGKHIAATYFSGSFDLELGSGIVFDQYGTAALSRVKLGNDKLSFEKKYCRRRDLINYSFSRQDDDTWEGVYSGTGVGRGPARCVLTAVSYGFVLPPESILIEEVVPERPENLN